MSDTEDAPFYGGAWRSRFLRAPKAALSLAARPDFVALGDLAEVKLGLKTGCDGFFFVERQRRNKARRDPELIRVKDAVLVRGLDDWSGPISKRDLLAAVLNPHQLFDGDGRVFTIPASTPHLYLYPRDAAPRAGLKEYIELAERKGIHKRKLVASNGSPTRWYRQVRALVTSPWAVPYSSAYDYGAWENPHGAALNGRFVGVQPKAGVDSDLLGAVLNSTFAVAGRLLEGVATGAEGAFDVGPPAARLIRLPDVRRISGNDADAIRDILNEIRKANRMPAAPGADLSVPRLRAELDIALLRGLGLTRGEAAGIASGLYESYARWRAAVAKVEDRMQEHRRAMARSGQSRTVSPLELAGRRVWEEIQHESPAFPRSVLAVEDELDSVELPRSIPMPAQDSLFDDGIVMGTKRKPVNLGSHDRARYAAMLSLIGFEPPYLIPKDAVKARAIVDKFLGVRTAVANAARTRAAAYVASVEATQTVLDYVDRHWLAQCRAGGMRREQDSA